MPRARNGQRRAQRERDTRERRALDSAVRDGERDRADGHSPMAWPWDDGGRLEQAYQRGYHAARRAA